jgi:1,4-alpha-glucan branching enzyme
MLATCGNNDSFHYCRRQWHLADDPLLKYKYLNQFEQDMMRLETRFGWLQPRHRHASITWIHEDMKVLVYEKSNLVFIVNLHPSASQKDFRVGVSHAGKYRIVLSTDDERLGGQNRVDTSIVAFSQEIPWNDKPASVLVYVPARVALVLTREVDELTAAEDCGDDDAAAAAAASDDDDDEEEEDEKDSRGTESEDEDFVAAA